MNNNYESHAISRRSFLKASGVVGAAGILAACGGNSGSSSTAASSGATSAPNTTGATPLKEFISWESTNRELESWNMLYSQMASDMNVTTNLWEGLLSFDCYGKVAPAIAKSWVVLGYLPYLVLAGLITGTLTGLCAQLVVGRLSRN